MSLEQRLLDLYSSVDSELATQAQELDAQAAELDAKTQEIAAQAVQIADLQAQLSKVPPPASAPVVFSNLELCTLWRQPGTVGNTGGGSTTAPSIGIMTPGSPAEFKTTSLIKYNNPYWYVELEKIKPAVLECTKFRYEVSWQFPSLDDLNSCQAVEIELQKRINGTIYNMAWQMPLKEKFSWCAFNFETKKFEPLPTPIPLDKSLIQPGKILVVVADCHIDPVAQTVTFDGLQINDKFYSPGLVHNATPDASHASLNNFHVGFQLDTIGVTPPPSYRLLTSNMKVTASK
jgi:hypothetical protein